MSLLLNLALSSALMIPELGIGSETFLVDTPKYSFEVPKGWKVGEETPWGARDISKSQSDGKLGAMTAGPTKATWDELYKTSLYFIQRESKGDPTPFRIGKSKQGYETMSFEVLDKNKFASRRYTLLINSSGSALALSVKIPTQEAERDFIKIFQHMVDTAKIK